MFSVIIGGCNARHPETFFMSRPKGLNHSLLLIVKCCARFKIEATEFTIQPNSALFIDCNTPYQYQSIRGDYIDDWMHFDCSAPRTLQALGIPINQPIPLGDPTPFSTYIQQIIWEKNYTHETYQRDNINMLMQVLINNILLADQERDRFHQYSPYYSKLQRLRMDLQSVPYKNYSPEEISVSIGISSSYFQHLYANFFGVPFKSDLINMRIEYVKSMILNSDLKLEEIAAICGYTNEIHFYRQFRQKTGLTPREYRIKGGLIDQS